MNFASECRTPRVLTDRYSIVARRGAPYKSASSQRGEVLLSNVALVARVSDAQTQARELLKLST